MSTAPLIPVEVLGGIDDVELRRRAAQLPLAIDLDDPDARPLLWSLVFERWPDLLSTQDLDNATRFYNQYFWFVRFASAWQAAHGHDAGLEQQAFKMLETAPPEAVWGVVAQLDHQARDTREQPGHR
jgi:hypothetical protein